MFLVLAFLNLLHIFSVNAPSFPWDIIYYPPLPHRPVMDIHNFFPAQHVFLLLVAKYVLWGTNCVWFGWRWTAATPVFGGRQVSQIWRTRKSHLQARPESSLGFNLQNCQPGLIFPFGLLKRESWQMKIHMLSIHPLTPNLATYEREVKQSSWHLLMFWIVV